MALSRKDKAHLIIHSFATAAAGFSAAFALVPVAGPVLFDTAGLTALTVGMTYSLAGIFGKKFEEGTLWTFGTVALGFAAGNALFKAFSSLIPVYGSMVNAATTFTLHEATGWALYLIFEGGGDPTKMSKDEIKRYITLGKRRADTERASYDAMMAKLPIAKRTEVERLQRELARTSLTTAQREALAERISRIVEQHQ